MNTYTKSRKPLPYWTLTYTLKSGVQKIVEQVHYALCVKKKQECERSGNFKYGTLDIKWDPK